MVVSKSLKVAYVDLSYKTKSFEEIIDFYTFNPYLSNVVVNLQKYIVNDTSIDVYKGARCVSDIGPIKDFDEVILYEIPSIEQIEKLSRDNRVIKLRLTRTLALGETVPPTISTIYSKDPKLTSRTAKVYHVPLNVDFSFIDDLNIKHKKNSIVFYYSQDTFSEVIEHIQKLKNLNILKSNLQIILVGPPPSNFDSSQNILYTVSLFSEISIVNFERILSGGLLFIDFISTKATIIRDLAYRYEVAYYSKVNFNDATYHNIEELTEEEYHKLLVVSHFRNEKVEAQMKELETKW